MRARQSQPNARRASGDDRRLATELTHHCLLLPWNPAPGEPRRPDPARLRCRAAAFVPSPSDGERRRPPGAAARRCTTFAAAPRAPVCTSRYAACASAMVNASRAQQTHHPAAVLCFALCIEFAGQEVTDDVRIVDQCVVDEAGVVPQPERPVLPDVFRQRQVAQRAFDRQSNDVLSSIHVVIEARNAHAQAIGDRADGRMFEAELERRDRDCITVDAGRTAECLRAHPGCANAFSYISLKMWIGTSSSHPTPTRVRPVRHTASTSTLSTARRSTQISLRRPRCVRSSSNQPPKSRSASAPDGRRRPAMEASSPATTLPRATRSWTRRGSPPR